MDMMQKTLHDMQMAEKWWIALTSGRFPAMEVLVGEYD